MELWIIIILLAVIAVGIWRKPKPPDPVEEWKSDRELRELIERLPKQ